MDIYFKPSDFTWLNQYLPSEAIHNQVTIDE